MMNDQALTVTEGSYTNQSNTIGYVSDNIAWYGYPFYGRRAGDWPYTSGSAWPNTWQQTIVLAPQVCAGEVHVFGCEHTTECKCGKASRKIERPKCAHCGKKK
jgi:hypothetical protein